MLLKNHCDVLGGRVEADSLGFNSFKGNWAFQIVNICESCCELLQTKLWAFGMLVGPYISIYQSFLYVNILSLILLSPGHSNWKVYEPGVWNS